MDAARRLAREREGGGAAIELILALGLLVGSTLVTALLVGLLRRLALERRLLDVPNERSLHQAPTPRGGGLAFVLVVVVASLAFSMLDVVPRALGLALALGGSVVAALGFFDDLYTLGNRVRLAVWLATAAVAAWALGGLPILSIGAFHVPLGAFGIAVATIGIVWVVNLYNFMDGVDGLAGSQAVIVSAAAAAFLWLRGHADLALVSALVGSSVLGFLAWNWPPARIFMGDVGSGFLGFVFAALAIWTSNQGVLDLQVWAVLLGVFLVDATLTMARRMAAGETWYKAHRSHVYQRAVTSGYSHRSVTLAVIAIDVGLVGAAFAMLVLPGASQYFLGASLLALAAAWFVLLRRWPAGRVDVIAK